jgi:oligopeptide/dipeptide ABC transporter ATP-binding protein
LSAPPIEAQAGTAVGGPLLELEGLDVSYTRRGQPPVRAVVGASLTVGQGEIVGLVGESGCGKSTLGRAAVGLVAPSAGHVRYRGQPVQAVWRGARPSQFRSLQMVFQDPYSSLNPRRRVGRQIADAIRLGTGAKIDDKVAATRVGELLERVGLTAAVSHRFPHEFSGGQCQRIAIARVLATEPSCVVADEPISSLDASAQAQIANLLAGIVTESGLGMLFISHDLSVVRKIADRTVVMYFGRVVESGPTEGIWSEPAHPYTRGLIGAIPEPGARAALPSEIKGDVPDPARPPRGCRFHPRCPEAIDRCRSEDPPPVEVEPGWQSLCLLSQPRRAPAGRASGV